MISAANAIVQWLLKDMGMWINHLMGVESADSPSTACFSMQAASLRSNQEKFSLHSAPLLILNSRWW
jgi:hypothetical protein